jgi:D-xylose 1-dehydrogenase (NADP+, D-xylono-1,5-lactone-forming)
VLCEKPLSSSPQQVAELFDLAESRGLHLSEAFMYRHHPQTAQIKQMVDAGEIGILRLIRGSFSFSCDPDDPRMKSGMDGGGLMDVGCYPLNLARLLAGEPERVSAEQLTGGESVDVMMAAVMRFANGVIGYFDSGLAMPDRHELEVVGSTAVLRIPHPWKPTRHGIEVLRDGATEAQVIGVGEANSYAIEVADLCAAVRGEHAPLLGRADAVGQSRAMAALYESAARGQSVTL